MTIKVLEDISSTILGKCDPSYKSDEENRRYSKIHTLTEVGAAGEFTWRDHRLFADWLIRRTEPETVVDLGVDYGYSTFCFALPEIGHVYGIDSFGKEMNMQVSKKLMILF